mgnify:FL=1
MQGIQKWTARLLLAGLLFHGTLGAAEAATIASLRGGVTAERARVVLNLDSAAAYTSSVSGRWLFIELDGKAERTQRVRLKDPRIQKAVLLPKGNKSQLGILFRNTVPAYKIFALKNPNRLVVDFPRNGSRTASLTGTSQWVGKGLRYRQSTVNLGAGNVKTYVLTLSPQSDFKLDFVPGYGNTIQKGTLTGISRRSGAVALVNASYFDSDIWVVGNLKIQNKWLGMETTPRTGLILPEAGTPSIEPGLHYQGTVTRSDGKTYAIGGINRMRLANEMVLYNDGYDATTDTNSYGTEVQLVGDKVRSKSQKGSMALYQGTTVLSGNGSAASFLNSVRKGDNLTLSQTLGSAAADAAPSVASAGPLLVYNGQVKVTGSEEKIAPDIAQGRAPRTGVGIKKDGTVLLVVADGRSKASAGFSLNEFAKYFVKLGADRAMNFDGGGSSEMVIRGRVMNKPSDGQERAVRVALGLFRK